MALATSMLYFLQAVFLCYGVSLFLLPLSRYLCGYLLVLLCVPLLAVHGCLLLRAMAPWAVPPCRCRPARSSLAGLLSAVFFTYCCECVLTCVSSSLLLRPLLVRVLLLCCLSCRPLLSLPASTDTCYSLMLRRLPVSLCLCCSHCTSVCYYVFYYVRCLSSLLSYPFCSYPMLVLNQSWFRLYSSRCSI